MKFTVAREAFLKSLNPACGFAGREGLIPILSNVHINASDTGALWLTCSDMESGLVSRLDAQVIEGGKGCVSATRLAAYISGVDAPEVQLAVNGSGSMAVFAGRNKAKFPVIEASGYPDLPEMSGDAWTLPLEDFQTALTRTLISTARTDGMVGAHRGAIHFEPSDGKMVMTSADDHRLTLCEVECGCHKFEAFDMHRDSASKLLRLLKASSEATASISLDGNHIFMAVGPSVVLLRRMAGISYPAYAKRIPKPESGGVVVDAKSLLRAIQSARSVSDQTQSAVDLEVTESEIMVRCGGQAGEVSNSVDCVVKDYAPGKLRMNHAYICEFLSLTDGPVGFRYPRPAQNDFWVEGDATYRHFIAGMHS